MKRSGFTLVELIISLTIFAVLLGGIFYALGVELDFWQRIVSASEKQQIANMVLTRMTRDVQSAREILPASNQNKLLLKIGSDTIEYSMINNKVRRKKNNYSAYLTDKGDLQILSFSYPAAKLVEIKLEEFKSKAFLRN